MVTSANNTRIFDSSAVSTSTPVKVDHFSQALKWRNTARKCYQSGDDMGYRAALTSARYHEARLSSSERAQYRKAL